MVRKSRSRRDADGYELQMNSEPHHFLMTKDPVLCRKFLKATARRTNFPNADRQTPRYFFFWARNAIFHGLRALGLSPGDHVLVPSYICSAAIEPILAYGARTDYYQIHRDCQPDFSDLESKIRPQTKAVLAVYYFGFPPDISRFRDLCDRKSLYLIEDCAHVLYGEVDNRRIGSFGDISVFSWRKFLPLYDGGELVLNGPRRELIVDWRQESLLFTLKVAKNLLDQAAAPDGRPLLKTAACLLSGTKRIWDRLRRETKPESSAFSVDANSTSFDETFVNQPMSRPSQWVLERSDIAAILAKRRANYLYLRQALRSLGRLTLPFPDLPSGVFPWVFPVVFNGLEKAHLALRRRGIPAVTWSAVRHPSISRESFPDADFLYENLVMLPLHHCLEERDLLTMVEAVKSVRRNGC